MLVLVLYDATFQVTKQTIKIFLMLFITKKYFDYKRSFSKNT